MRIYKDQNVFDEALDRIRFLFDEFDEVYVTVSGGKDSTIIYELTKIVARERNRLPLKVVFLDQEAEYQATIDMIREIMYSDDVEPYWLQVPIKLFNATSNKSEWLMCWGEDGDWLREKEDISYKENIWGTDRFHEMFQHFANKMQKDTGKKICDITGVRAEESLSRLSGLTQQATYKDKTWGKKNKFNKNAFTFHPIYDWSYMDVWKAIHDNGWTYNKVYDYQYQYGVQTKDMRVSNLHHETSVHALFMLQEVEPNTYQKLTERISGMDTAGKLGKEDFFIKTLPFMFSSWKEYRDYLLEKLVDDDKRPIFQKQFDRTEEKYGRAVKAETMFKTHINCIMANDWHGTKLGNAEHRWRLQLKNYQKELKQNEMARRKAEREQQQK